MIHLHSRPDRRKELVDVLIGIILVTVFIVTIVIPFIAYLFGKEMK